MELPGFEALASLGAPAPTYDPAAAPRRQIEEALNRPQDSMVELTDLEPLRSDASYSGQGANVPRVPTVGLTNIEPLRQDTSHDGRVAQKGRARKWISSHITDRVTRPAQHYEGRSQWFAQVRLHYLEGCCLTVYDPNKLQVYGGPTGYPSLAAFMDSDDSFMIYRQFGYVQARLLLEKQAQLRSLEEALDEDDNKESLNHRTYRDKDDFLFRELEKAFLEYAELLTAVQKLRSFERPSLRDYQSLKNWVHNETPLVFDDTQWVYEKEDLVALRASCDPQWIETMIEHQLARFYCPLVEYLFTSKHSRTKTGNDPTMVMFAESRVQALALSITTLLIAILLVLPIFACYLVVTNVSSGEAYGICIAILLGFTLIFSAFVMTFTKAKRHEVLAATSAYSAVLVVFLGNIGK